MSRCYPTGIHVINKQPHVGWRSYSTDMAKGLMTFVVCSSLVLVAAQAASAQERERSGKEIVEAVCAGCHRSGVDGAPKIGDRAAWAKLASQGLTGLTEAALKGMRKMPPHGGNPDLSDTEIQRAISYMVNRSGGNWIEPPSKLASAVQRSGEEVVQAYCARCHQSGAGGAPRIGDRAAWIPRLKGGFQALVRSAIKGYGPMPSRADVANLDDSEIRAAIVYMINGDDARTTRPSVALSTGPARSHQIVDEAGMHSGIVGWLRSLWTRFRGDSATPKRQSEREQTGR